MKAIRDLMDVVYGSGVECRVFSATHDDCPEPEPFVASVDVSEYKCMKCERLSVRGIWFCFIEQIAGDDILKFTYRIAVFYGQSGGSGEVEAQDRGTTYPSIW